MFTADMIGTPCIVVGHEKLPAGAYDKDWRCVIAVPFDLTRPDGLVYYGPDAVWLPIAPAKPGQVIVVQPDGSARWEDR